MHRLSKLFALFACALMSAACGVTFAATSTHKGTANDAAVIYSAFLNSWSENGRATLNVAKLAAAPSPEDIKQFTACANKLGAHSVQWGKAESVPDLSRIIGTLSYVHFINAKHWHALDPGHLIASGESVGAAVRAGIAHSLTSLSAIVYNKSHTLAMFQFANRCGSLCGTGHIVVFKKTSAGWVLQKRTPCGGWEA